MQPQKSAAAKNENAEKYYEKITKIFVSDSLERVNIYCKLAVAAFAEGDELKMLLIGLKRFTKLEPANPAKLRCEVADKLIEENKYCF